MIGTDLVEKHVIQEVAGTASDPLHMDEDIISMRMVRQLSALLRQQLERKVKEEPQRYNQTWVDRIMRGFEDSLPDVQATIANRVRSRIAADVRQDILRVLEDALNDGAEPLENPVRNQAREAVPPVINGKAPRRSENGTLAVEGDEILLRSWTNGEEAHEGPDAPVVQPAQRPADHPTLTPVQEQHETAEVPEPALQATRPLQPEAQGVRRSSNGDGPPKEPSDASLEEIYEGTVNLHVEANGSIRPLIDFMGRLRENLYLRILQLENQKERIGIQLRLTAPLPLKEVLLQMEGVSQVEDSCWLEPSGTTEQGLNVRLLQIPPLD